MLEWVFWSCLACVAYTYVGYPLLMAGWAWWRPRVPERRPFRGSFSTVLSAHNEESGIGRRLEELCRHVRDSGLTGEIVIVSDGSNDATAARARAFEACGLVRVFEVQENIGKAAALTLGCQSARGEILLFADARQTWAPDVVPTLLENFADPTVGAVSGDLVLESATGMLAGVGLYWRFEKWLRKNESLVHGQVGVTGAISAVRRELFRPIPPGTLLDDVYWPLCVAMAGHRVIHDDRARALDRLPEKPRDEFRRKVRTLCGNYQLAWRLPASLLPWRNPVWLAWVSHKLCRLLVPWALLAVLGTSMFLSGAVYEAALVAQATGYGVAVVGLLPGPGRKMKLAGAAASFLVLNVAAWLAFFTWLSGRADRTWRKVNYDAPVDVTDRVCTSH